MSGNEILVGYDGSPDAARALDWALDEAGRSGRPVCLAYVFEWLTVAGWIGPGLAPGVWPDEEARRQVEELVRRAAADASAAHPELAVTGQVYDGPPALVLQERSAEADLLVLGTRGHGGFGELLAGSTAVTVTAHAHCPVVVVRDGTPQRSHGHVVVGLDGSEPALLALGFAYEQAQTRRVPLHVVHAWQPQADRATSSGADAEGARAEVEEVLSRWRGTYPEVTVSVEVTAGSASSLLVDASRQAALVVVGTRGRGGLRGMLLGSVSQQLLHHAHCPVAVVRQR